MIQLIGLQIGFQILNITQNTTNTTKCLYAAKYEGGE